MVGRKLVFEIQLGLLIVSTSFSWYALAKGINVKPGFFSEGHAGAFAKIPPSIGQRRSSANTLKRSGRKPEAVREGGHAWAYFPYTESAGIFWKSGARCQGKFVHMPRLSL